MTGVHELGMKLTFDAEIKLRSIDELGATSASTKTSRCMELLGGTWCRFEMLTMLATNRFLQTIVHGTMWNPVSLYNTSTARFPGRLFRPKSISNKPAVLYISDHVLTGPSGLTQVSLRQQLVTLHEAQNKHLTTAAFLRLTATRSKDSLSHRPPVDSTALHHTESHTLKKVYRHVVHPISRNLRIPSERKTSCVSS